MQNHPGFRYAASRLRLFVLVYIEPVGYAMSMSKFILILICIFISFSVTAETVYKKTSPDGSVEFTDQNLIDSEEIKIRKPTTFHAPRLPRSNLPTKKLKPTFNYSLTINQPLNDSILVGQKDVLVSVSVKPDIARNGHLIHYQLGGQSIVSRNMSETFKNVSRGTYNLNISIVDVNGNIVGPVATIVFHMKRFFKKPTPPQLPKKKIKAP